MAILIIEPENFSRMMISFCVESKTGGTAAFLGIGLWPDASFGP
jgi:hypothetical protein